MVGINLNLLHILEISTQVKFFRYIVRIKLIEIEVFPKYIIFMQKPFAAT